MPTKSSARATLSRIGSTVPKTVGGMLALYRRTEELSQREVAALLHISTSYLSDIENGNRRVSPGSAAKYARKLGMPADIMVRCSIQEQLEEAGLKFTVDIGVE